MLYSTHGKNTHAVYTSIHDPTVSGWFPAENTQLHFQDNIGYILWFEQHISQCMEQTTKFLEYWLMFLQCLGNEGTEERQSKFPDRGRLQEYHFRWPLISNQWHAWLVCESFIILIVLIIFDPESFSDT